MSKICVFVRRSLALAEIELPFWRMKAQCHRKEAKPNQFDKLQAVSMADTHMTDANEPEETEIELITPDEVTQEFDIGEAPQGTRRALTD